MGKRADIMRRSEDIKVGLENKLPGQTLRLGILLLRHEEGLREVERERGGGDGGRVKWVLTEIGKWGKGEGC